MAGTCAAGLRTHALGRTPVCTEGPGRGAGSGAGAAVGGGAASPCHSPSCAGTGAMDHQGCRLWQWSAQLRCPQSQSGGCSSVDLSVLGHKPLHHRAASHRGLRQDLTGAAALLDPHARCRLLPATVWWVPMVLGCAGPGWGVGWWGPCFGFCV